MNELKQLTQKINSFLFPDRFDFNKTVQLRGKIGFFGAAPANQHSSTGVRATSTAGGFNLTDTATWTGGIGSTGYTVGDVVAALKEYGLLAK